MVDNYKLNDVVEDLETRVIRLEDNQDFLKELLEKNTVSNEKLSETMHGVAVTLVKINDKIDLQTKSLEDMKSEVEETNRSTNEKITSISKRVQVVEERSKFDMVEYLKKNFPWIIIILGMSVMYASQFFKV